MANPTQQQASPDVIGAATDQTVQRLTASWRQGEEALMNRQVAALEQIAKVLKKQYQIDNPDEPDEGSEAQPKTK